MYTQTLLDKPALAPARIADRSITFVARPFVRKKGFAMQLFTVQIEKPEAVNFILGQTHFIKSVEDLHEVLVAAAPGIKFGLAFCEASGKCLVRRVLLLACPAVLARHRQTPSSFATNYHTSDSEACTHKHCWTSQHWHPCASVKGTTRGR